MPLKRLKGPYDNLGLLVVSHLFSWVRTKTKSCNIFPSSFQQAVFTFCIRWYALSSAWRNSNSPVSKQTKMKVEIISCFRRFFASKQFFALFVLQFHISIASHEIWRKFGILLVAKCEGFVAFYKKQVPCDNAFWPGVPPFGPLLWQAKLTWIWHCQL